MLNYLLVVLAIVELIFFIPIFINYLISYIKYRVGTIKYVLLFVFFMGIGIFWESLRLLFHMMSFYYEILDEFIFILKTGFTFIGIFILIELTVNILNRTGFSTRYDILLRIIYFATIPLLSFLNFFTYIRLGPNDFGIYDFQVDFLMVPLFYIIYFPVALNLYYRINKIKTEFKTEKTGKIFSLFNSLLILITFDRLFAISYAYYYGINIFAVICNFCLKFSYSLGIFILLIKYPDFLEFIGVYFDINSIYLINKKGVTIYHHDFQVIDKNIPNPAKDLVLGGFIYAISRGLKSIIKSTGELEIIKIGKVSIIFTFGKYVFGTLFATADTPLLRERLKAFVERVEGTYEVVLSVERRGHIILTDPKYRLNELVEKFFR